MRVIGTGRLQDVTLVRGADEVHQQACDTDEIELTWTDEAPLNEPTYYYARVQQADGHLAWTSPVWVEM